VRPGGVALRFLYVGSGEIRGNTIIEPLDWIGRHELADESREVYGVRHYPRTQFSAISVWASRNVRIEDNVICDPHGYCRDGAIQVGDYTEGITVEGNRVGVRPEPASVQEDHRP
jgi:hypothetical protein